MNPPRARGYGRGGDEETVKGLMGASMPKACQPAEDTSEPKRDIRKRPNCLSRLNDLRDGLAFTAAASRHWFWTLSTLAGSANVA